jgi:DNA-binding SARP family transcriptional activator/energy-coupling factor transporter ATP-binding protein EcfA2
VVSRLAVLVLGPPQIELDGVSIRLDRRKAIALLVYLAVTGERHQRDSLVNLLWPEYDSPRGRAALRRTLYALRKELEGAWLNVDREEIALRPDAEIWVDAVEFQRHLDACEGHRHPASQVCPDCVPLLSEAVALVRGELLSGFSLKDSFNFDDWQRLQAEALRRELDGALERLVHWHSGQREFEAATAYARRRLSLDPLDEGAHRQLMQLYAWSGRRPAALRQYEECVAVLQDQLGVPPQDPTTALYQAIQTGHIPPPPTTEPLQPMVGATEQDRQLSPGGVPDLIMQPPSFLEGEVSVERPVFVARERELSQLEGHLKAALAGQGKVVFVTGDAGSGKTALIQAFGGQAQADHGDLIVAGGHGNAHTGVGDPYLPFREILGLLTGDVEAQWAAGAMTKEQARRLWQLLPLSVQALVRAGPDLVGLLVPGPVLVARAATFQPGPGEPIWLTQLGNLVAGKAADPTMPGLLQSALFEQYTQVLRMLASQQPLLLALDDLQWADSGSVSLLFHLGRRIAGSRILIVGAYRPAEVALGYPGSPLVAELAERGIAEGGPAGSHRERHPLQPVVNEFKRIFGNIEVDLDKAEGRQLVDALLDSEPNRMGHGFREALHLHTQGHPLFTVELLRGMQERGDLAQDQEGMWAEGPTLDWETLPARVEAVVAERIDRLPLGLRDLLSVASVEGETFTAEVVARVQDAGEREVVQHLSATLDRKHRLVSARGIQQMGSQRLSQYRFRHILYQKYLYHSLDAVEQVHLHQAVGTALETLYSAATQETSRVAPQLARHFEEAGIVQKAIHYLRQAGERAVQLSAY